MKIAVISDIHGNCVALEAALADLRERPVDRMVCLRAPRNFEAVGQFYLRFNAVEDREVLEILQEEQKRRKVTSESRG